MLIVAGLILGLSVAGVVGLLVFRVRRTLANAARARPPLSQSVVQPRLARAAQPLPEPPRPTIEPRSGLHLHFHGVQAEDVAAIIRQWQDRNGTDRQL